MPVPIAGFAESFEAVGISARVLLYVKVLQHVHLQYVLIRQILLANLTKSRALRRIPPSLKYLPCWRLQ